MDQASFLLVLFLVLDALFIAAWSVWRWRKAKRPAPSPVLLQTVTIPPLLVERFYFSAESASLPRGDEGVERLAEYLKAYAVEVVLEGSADESGNLTRNRRLSQGRAEAVRRALVERGVKPDRLKVTALEPAPGRTEADKQRLRCVRVILKS